MFFPFYRMVNKYDVFMRKRSNFIHCILKCQEKKEDEKEEKKEEIKEEKNEISAGTAGAKKSENRTKINSNLDKMVRLN